jgi:DNA recombination protein RmuC
MPVEPLALIVACVIALLIGLALGVFFGSRPAADWKARHAERDDEAKRLADQVSRMAPELATMSERAERADTLAGQLDEARMEREALRAELAALKEKAANFEEQKRLLMEARETLLKEFQNAGHAVLSKAQETLLERAAERLGYSEKASEEKIKALLQPVGENLKRYERRVEGLEKERNDAFSRLSQQINEMKLGQNEVREEARRLGDSLRNVPKARGRWGEHQLKNVLEHCGLSEHTDFLLEHSVETEEGRLRPDAIINVPGQKKLVIDAKVSLNAYQEAFEAENEDSRAKALLAHSRAMRGHVQQLGAKAYHSQFEEAPDYVIMFVPGEHFVTAALEQDPDLWDFAFRNGVLLATPTNLVAIARTVAQVWRQDELAREAKEVGRLGAELYDRLAKVTEDLGKMGTHLGRAVNSYNEFTRSFESRVLVSARRMQEKGIEIGKRQIEDLALIDNSPQSPVNGNGAVESAAD